MKFEDKDFQVEGKKEQGCLLTLHITASPEAVKKSYKQAVKGVNKEISVPGFRKGKAPDDVVISKFGPSIEREWKENVLQDSFQGALNLVKIYPISKEAIQKPKLERCSLEEGATCTITFEHYPEVPELDFSQVTLPHVEKEKISDERVNEIKEEIRKSNATWEDVEGRSIQEGDYVDISIDATNVEPPSVIVKDRRFEVAEKRMTRWLKNILVGKNVGDVLEGVTEADPDADENIQKQFKATPVRITIHSIKKIILPELNDELATKAGANSVDDLESKIRENLDKEAEDVVKAKRLSLLDNALYETFPFDLPRSILKKEIEYRLERKVSDQPNASKEEEAVFEKQAAEEAARALALYFLHKKMERQGNISVSNQELNDEVVHAISANPHLFRQEMDKEQSQRFISSLAERVLDRKIREWALAQIN